MSKIIGRIVRMLMIEKCEFVIQKFFFRKFDSCIVGDTVVKVYNSKDFIFGILN